MQKNLYLQKCWEKKCEKNSSFERENVEVVGQFLLSADHLVAVVLLSQHPQTGLDDTTTQTKHQVQCRF